MSILDQLYEQDERHQRYTQDTKVALDELVAKSKQVVGQEAWEKATTFPASTAVKELPTRVFINAARLLARAKDTSIVLSRLSKLALDRAICDRKDQAIFYKVLSTRSPEQKRIYDAHVYFIKVLAFIRSLLSSLFQKADANVIEDEATPERGSSYRLLLDWADDEKAQEPRRPMNGDEDGPPLIFWTIIDEYLNDVLDIRDHLRKFWTLYSENDIPLLVVFALTHIAFRMIEERTTVLIKRKPQLDKTCPADVAQYYKAYGVIGVLHLAFQEHDAKLRADTRLIDVKMQAALAQIGLDRFFAPTGAKLVEYRINKDKREPTYLRELESVSNIIPFGAPFPVQNGRTLSVDVNSALYSAAWYENTGRVMIREYSRMAVLDSLVSKPRYPVRDRLTDLLSSSLLGPDRDGKKGDDQSKDDLLASILLHIVMDQRVSLAERADQPLRDARNIARSVPSHFDVYEGTPNSDLVELDKVVAVRDSILSDPMAIPKNFGNKKMRGLQKKDPALASIQAHLQSPPTDALKLYNPVLSAHLAFAVLDGQRSGATQLEKKAPNIPVFLCLYVGLEITGRLSRHYEDAEKIISWYGEQHLFGPNGRPKTVQEVQKSVTRLLKLESGALTFPTSEIETLVSDFVSSNEENSGLWEKLHGLITDLTRPSKDEAAPPGERTGEAPVVHNDSQTQPHVSSSTPSNQPTPAPNKPIQKSLHKHKTAARLQREHAKAKAKVAKQELESSTRPRDPELLATLKDHLRAQDHVQMSFNPLSFRTRITPVLQRNAELCLQQGFRLDEKMQGQPQELGQFVAILFHILVEQPDVGDKIAGEVAAMVRGIVQEDGRAELDVAEGFCGVKVAEEEVC